MDALSTDLTSLSTVITPVITVAIGITVIVRIRIEVSATAWRCGWSRLR